jgi:cyclopropane fatty-acyl-phospholipid synthase-like methyltransferase
MKSEVETYNDAEFVSSSLALGTNSRLLDIGCGNGRIALALARRGINVVGIDSQPSCIASARRMANTEGLRVEFRRQDMRQLAYQGTFTHALLWWGTFGYYSDRDNHAILFRIQEALSQGGELLVDVLLQEYLLANFSQESMLRGESWEAITYRSWCKRSSRVCATTTFHGTTGTISLTSSIRVYSKDELVELLRGAGFSCVDFLATYSDVKRSYCIAKSLA